MDTVIYMYSIPWPCALFNNHLSIHAVAENLVPSEMPLQMLNTLIGATILFSGHPYIWPGSLLQAHNTPTTCVGLDTICLWLIAKNICKPSLHCKDQDEAN